MNPTISIIVPVYKVERFLTRCVDSILSQSYSDYELLLIDDGSPDSSGNICDNYALNHSHIKVFHKQNGGVSSARNVGLDNAKGKYILFVDADDELAPNALTAFVETTKKWPTADVIQGGVVSVGGDKGFLVNPNNDWKEFDDSPNGVVELLIHRTPWGIWSKLFRREIIETNHIRFSQGIIMGEDQLFMYKFQFYASSYALCSMDTYLYHLDNDGSVMHNRDKTNAYCSEIKVAEEAVVTLPPKVNPLLYWFVDRFLDYDNYRKNIEECLDRHKVAVQIKDSCRKIRASECPFWAKFMFWYLTLPDIFKKNNICLSLYYRITNLLR